jgi:hypothetical protein
MLYKPNLKGIILSLMKTAVVGWEPFFEGRRNLTIKRIGEAMDHSPS